MYINTNFSTYQSFNKPLSLDYIRAIAPSVFAESKHESRSDRYTYIPTSHILDGMMSEGFLPYYAIQGKSRIEGKAEYTKHMLRFRKGDAVTENSFEIILINSHDGTSSYKMMAGSYRLVCSNGLMHFDSTIDVKVPHRGNIVDDVIEGAYTILSHQEQVSESIDKLRSISLNDREQLAFSNAALALKYEPNEAGQIIAPIAPAQLNRPRRNADLSPDLWTTFNRVQENLIKGGLRGRNASGNRTSTRAVTGIDSNVQLNRALWMLADSMANLKNAA